MAAVTINEQDLGTLKNQVIVVTGAASGIGLATVKLLLEKGAHVVAGDLQPVPINNERLTSTRIDVTSWKDLSDLFKLAKSNHSSIDHVFANAGIAGKTTYFDERFDEHGDLLEPTHLVLDINLKAVINTCALAIHHLRRQEDGGSIVLTASASSFQRFRAVDYATAKHGVLGLMRGLTALLQPEVPIRVNAISPSWTTTGMVPAGLLEKAAGISSQSPDVVAKSVAILMADRRRRGQMIYSVNGKYSEAEATLLKAANDILGDASDDLVMAKILKAAITFRTSDLES